MAVPNSELTPAERVSDLGRTGRALRAALRDALQRHRRDGDTVGVWREGRVVSLSADQIPVCERRIERRRAEESALIGVEP